jgi:hypothetical protein
VGSPPVEIIELGELVHGVVKHLVSLGNDAGIVAHLTGVDRRNPQISRKMVVIYIPDQAPSVIVEIESLLEQLDGHRHILLQHTQIRFWVARVLADVPKMGRAEQRVERGIFRITVERAA